MKRNCRMKKKLIILSGGFAFIVLVLLVLSFTLTRQTVDWDFIQKVGGIKTDIPLKTDEGFYLPVICNVSGLDSITIKPTNLNSALTCKRIKSIIIENTIHLKVITGLVVSKKENCNCIGVEVGNLKHGSYLVYYGDKSSFEHPIGKFTIK